MSDYSELKALAGAANAVTGDVNITMAVGTTKEEVAAVQDFLRLAMPKSILGLIAENERLTHRCGMYGLELTNEVERRIKAEQERDLFRAEIDEDKLHFQAMGKAVEDLVAERNQVRAECEGLRKLTTELRSTAKCYNLHHCKAEQHGISEPCKVLARIDAAMGKGEKS